jgi:hypothetical protein
MMTLADVKEVLNVGMPTIYALLAVFGFCAVRKERMVRSSGVWRW